MFKRLQALQRKKRKKEKEREKAVKKIRMIKEKYEKKIRIRRQPNSNLYHEEKTHQRLV